MTAQSFGPLLGAIRNAFMIGTYRKHTVAGIPAFRGDTLPEFAAPKHARARTARVHRLTTRLPSRTAPFEAVLRHKAAVSLSAAERLSLFFRYTSGPIRWEPINVHTVHRAIASPRSLFTSELRLQTRDAKSSKWTTHRYLPLHHALEPIRCTPSAADDGCSTKITVIGRLSRCAELYGVFSPHLVGLEAGMLLSQAALMCSMLGTETQTRIQTNEEDVRADLALEHWSDLPLATLRVYGRSWAEWLDDVALDEVVAVEEEVSVDVLNSYPSLREIVATTASSIGAHENDPAKTSASVSQFALHEETVSALNPAPVEPQLDVLDVLRRRSSGNDRTGFVPLNAARPFSLHALAATWSGLACLHADDELLRVKINVYIAVIRATDAACGTYRVDLSKGVVELIKETDVAKCVQDALTVGAYYNMREFSAAAAVTADYEDAIRIFGGKALFAVLQACGQRLHQFGIAAAEQRMFARPVKSYRESALECELALEGQLVLLSLAGFNRKANPAFELL